MDKRTKAFLKLIKMDESGELSVRSYSGRGMYGAECLGITGNIGSIFSNLMALALEAGHELSNDEKDDVIMALTRGVQTDSMGLGGIVYFPGCKLTRAEALSLDDDGEDEEDEDCTDDEE